MKTPVGLYVPLLEFDVSRGGEMPLDDAVDGLIAVEKIIGESFATAGNELPETTKSAYEEARDR
jgi:hypothetical protein